MSRPTNNNQHLDAAFLKRHPRQFVLTFHEGSFSTTFLVRQSDLLSTAFCSQLIDLLRWRQSALHMMPSPRSSPAIRPTTPLSPRYEPSRFEALLQATSSRGMQGHSSNTGRRKTAQSLRLPSLPRFHPANFPSAHSSMQNTPDSMDSVHGPLSPRTHQRMYSDAQKHLFMYHSQSIAAARAASPLQEKPTSPRLAPLGSPGPVTPFELEAEEYLAAGAHGLVQPGASHQEVVDKLVRENTRRTTVPSASSTSRPSSRH